MQNTYENLVQYPLVVSELKPEYHCWAIIIDGQDNTVLLCLDDDGYQFYWYKPEWHWNQPVIVKVDVYSFRIVLLELICYRKNVDWNILEEETILEECAYHCFEAHEPGKLVSGKEVDKRQM